MKRLLLALLATQNMAQAGVIMVDEPTKATPAATAAVAVGPLAMPKVPTVPTVAAQASYSSEIATKPLDAKSLRPDAQTKQDWVLKTSYATLEDALDDFASKVDYELVYEAREFPLSLKRDITLAQGVDFWEALRLLGESYRKSDGAFQILPTKYKQIVVLPMGQVGSTSMR